MATTAQAFGAALIGRTEKALKAILDRQLAGTGITEPQWVTLTLTVVGGGTIDRAELIRQVSGAAKFSEAEDLAAAGRVLSIALDRANAVLAGA
jgi:hypothetical protein